MRATAAGGSGSLPALAALTLLRRLCNTPDALFAGAEEVDDEETAFASSTESQRAVAQLMPLRAAWLATQPSEQPCAAGSSGKMAVLSTLLSHICATPGSRVVVVAGWTQTLNHISGLCDSLGLATARLDGSTPPDARVALVRRFNAGGAGAVFLLSTQAGGVGLNLVGANRLILFDSSWNPAHDAQAMARVWRDGQQKPVFLYRLLTAGTLEERIYQRSIFKGEVAAVVGAGGRSGSSFSAEELRALFSYVPGCICGTAELITRGGGASAAVNAQRWVDASASVEDAPLAAAVAGGAVTFVYAPLKNGSEAALHEAEALRAEEADRGAGIADGTDADEELALEEAAPPPADSRKRTCAPGGLPTSDWDDEDEAAGTSDDDFKREPAPAVRRRLRKVG